MVRFNDSAIRNRLLVEGLFSWQSVTCLALCLVTCVGLLASLSQKLYSVWGIALLVILLSLLCEILYLYARLNSKTHRASVIADLFRERLTFGIDEIQDRMLRARLLKAFEYWLLIQELIAGMRPGPLQTHLLPIVQQALHWLDQICTQVWSLHQRRLSLTHQIGSQPAERRMGIYQATTLANLKSATVQLDNTLQALEALYGCLLQLRRRPNRGIELTALQDEVFDQVAHLEDLVEAMHQC